MTTQLTRVLNFLSDGNWHSLPDIGKTLAINSRSAGSRIRDLRLNRYGKHQIEVRKTSQHQVFEYRMVSSKQAQNQTPNTAAALPLPMNFMGHASYIGPPKTAAKVKFFNVQTLDTEHHPHSQCALETVDGYPRVVAKDSKGLTIPHLITTQSSL